MNFYLCRKTRPQRILTCCCVRLISISSICITCVEVVSPSFLFLRKKKEKKREDARLDFPLLISLLSFIVPAYAIVIMGGSIRRGTRPPSGIRYFSIYIVPFAFPPLRFPCVKRSFSRLSRKRPRPFHFSTLKHGIFFVLRFLVSPRRSSSEIRAFFCSLD